MRIDGMVRDPAGAALAGAHVVALGAAREAIAEAETDARGRFALSGDGVVMVRVAGPDWRGPGAAVTTLPRLWRVPGAPRPARTSTDITLRGCVPVAVRAFARGRLLGDPTPETRQQMGRVWFFDTARKVAPGAFRWETGDGGPWLYLPPGQGTYLQVLWTAPGFGSLVCHARNAGRGIAAPGGGAPVRGLTATPDGTLELWLNEDLACSAHARLAEVWAGVEAEGYILGPDARAHREAAAAAMAALRAVALPSRDDLGYLDARARRAGHADAALAAALWAMEKLVMQKAEQDVVRNRRLVRTVRLRLPDGAAAAGARLRFRQTEHEFRFGVFVNPRTHPLSREPIGGAMWTAIRDLGINQLPLALLWSQLEPAPGRRRDAELEAQFSAAALHAAGFRLKAHLPVWPWHGKWPGQWNAFIPMWLYELDAAGVQQAAYTHMRALTRFFRNHVEVFQSINEPMLSHTNGVNLNLPETIELVRQAGRGIRDGGSTGPIEVNNCCLFAESVSADVREQGYERMPCEFFADLAAAGVEYDAIGIQLGYYGGYMYSELFQGGFPVRHILDLADLVDHYSQAGKPVLVTEVSVPSQAPPPEGPYVGEWHGPWTPERQADWIRLFYTMCYSKKQVREITWWNATDEAAFIRSGGLMTEDYRPKPAYHALRALINGWKAAGEGQSDAGGVAPIAGPAGVYEIAVEFGGRTYGPYQVAFGWEEGESADLVLTGA